MNRFASYWRFLRNISWRPVASYFFLLFIYYILMEMYATHRLDIIGALAVAFPLSFLLAWLLYHRFVRPLQEIIRVTEEMAQGRLDRELHIYSPDEIGVLARNINVMARRLKNNIAEITAEKNRAQAILNSMADGVIALDREGRILLINPVVEEWFGVRAGEVEGRSILEVIRHYDIEQVVRQALNTQRPITREVKVIVPVHRYFRLHVTPLEGPGQERGGVVILLRDVTERRKLEQMRSEFVANVSHELRTPLTSLRGFLETILQGEVEDPETLRRFLLIMYNETQRLSRLIDDLMDLSKIEERRVVHRWQEVNLREAIQKAIVLFTPRAQEKSIELKCELAPHLPVVQGDPDLLTQVLINLVDNAIKYTPAGGRVTVRAYQCGEEVKVEVEDTGIGIPPESLPRIFERFYRVEKSRARELGGVGLGLAIVKHIVQAHGGEVEVESQVGKGSVFSFVLPVYFARSNGGVKED